MKVSTPTCQFSGGIHSHTISRSYYPDQRPFRQYFAAADASALRDMLNFFLRFLGHLSSRDQSEKLLIPIQQAVALMFLMHYGHISIGIIFNIFGALLLTLLLALCSSVWYFFFLV